MRDLAREYRIAECAFDPWHFGGQPALTLEQEGLTMVEYPQTDVRMVPASAALRAAVVEGRLTHPNDPALNRHAAVRAYRFPRVVW